MLKNALKVTAAAMALTALLASCGNQDEAQARGKLFSLHKNFSFTHKTK